MTATESASSGRTRGSSRRCTSSSGPTRPSVSETWREFFADYHAGPTLTGAARRSRLPPAAATAPRPRGRRPRRAGTPAPPQPSALRRAPTQTPCRRQRRRRRAATPAADPRRRRRHRRQHGAQPRRPDGDQLPRRPGQAARGQPQGHQRLPQPQRAAARSASPTSSATPSCGPSPTPCPTMNNTFVEGADGKPRVVRNAARQHRPRRRRRQGRRHPHAGRAGAARRRHARLRRLPRRLRGPHPQGQDQQARRRATSRAPPSRSPTPARSARSSRVPRLMPGQGVIVGVGTIDYPAEFQGADASGRWPSSACRKVVTITSHLRPPHHPGRRVRPVPASGCTSCCSASTASTTTSSSASACPTRRSSGAATSARSTARRRCSHKQMQVATLIRVHRVRGHLIADLDPLRWKEPEHARRARPGDLRPDDLGPRPRVPHRRRRRQRRR